MCRLSINLGASTSWKSQGLSRPVMGLLYLHTSSRSLSHLRLHTDDTKPSTYAMSSLKFFLKTYIIYVKLLSRILHLLYCIVLYCTVLKSILCLALTKKRQSYKAHGQLFSFVVISCLVTVIKENHYTTQLSHVLLNLLQNVVCTSTATAPNVVCTSTATAPNSLKHTKNSKLQGVWKLIRISSVLKHRIDWYVSTTFRWVILTPFSGFITQRS
jgi:hypothetical protein